MSSTAPASISKSSRFWTLDAVRGLAVLAVVCFHVLLSLKVDARPSDPSTVWVSWLIYGGSLGVSVFFVLSGFSIHLSPARKLVAKEKTYPSWGKFFRRRFWRLYPAYVGAISLCLALNATWALIRGRNPFAYWPSTWDFLSHLLLLHTLQPETFFGIIPALWFIGVQAHFYLLYPFFYWLIQRWDIHRALLVALLCTLAFRLLSQTIVLPPTAHPEAGLVLWMNAPQRWFEWCFGAWVAQQVAQGIRPRLNYSWIVFLLTIAWIPTGSAVKVIYEPVLASLLGICLWYLVTYEERMRSHPVWLPLLYLGEISYSVYLLHQIFVPYVRSAVELPMFNVASVFAILLGLVLAITLPLAAFFHQWIELPLSRFERKPK
jgi:peptidoglycan/LPS O-acetylase OafA/YrhL